MKPCCLDCNVEFLKCWFWFQYLFIWTNIVLLIFLYLFSWEFCMFWNSSISLKELFITVHISCRSSALWSFNVFLWYYFIIIFIFWFLLIWASSASKVWLKNFISTICWKPLYFHRFLYFSHIFYYFCLIFIISYTSTNLTKFYLFIFLLIILKV